MSFDPVADGAWCNLCALRKLRIGDPVPSEFHREAIGTVIAEAPGKLEVARGRPLIGESGQEYEAALTTLGRPRKTFHVLNALSCRPPDDDLAKVMARLKTLNDDRLEAGLDKLPTPLQCCRGRLETDLRTADRYAPGSSNKIVVMGKIALEAVTGKRSPILDIRGAPITKVDERQIGYKRLIMPLPHPAFVLRARRWTKVFRADLGRAIRWFETGTINWLPPRVLVRPTPAQLRRWLLEMPSQWRGDPTAFSAITDDVETTVEGGPMWNRLRCAGFGKLDADERGVGILFLPLLSVDGFTRFYSAADEREVQSVLREYFAREDIEHWGHNHGYFDELVWGEYIAEDKTLRLDGAKLHPFSNFKNRNDTIIDHRAVESELPHKLGFVGSAYTDTPGAWKAAHTATEAASDIELREYNLIDVSIQARIAPKLREAVTMRDQQDVIRKDYRLQEVAKGLHRNGIPVHEPTRQKWEDKLRAEAGERSDTTDTVTPGTLYKRLCDIAGDDSLNPRSPPQLRKLIFKTWGLAPAMDPEGRKQILTMSGYPSTSNAAILELRRRGDAPHRVIEFIDTLRKYRKKSKLLSTYILRLRPPERTIEKLVQAFADAEEGDDAEPLTLGVDDLGRIKHDFIDPSGGLFDEREDVREGSVTRAARVHGSINVHTPKTGRISITRPGLQTYTRELRDIFRARPGWKFTIADKDQIELRHTCARAGAGRYLQVFAEKKEKIKNADGTWTIRGDPHSLAAEMAFGKKFSMLTPGSVDWEKIRDFVKRLVYACSYWAMPPTVHRVITSVEDANGTLLYPDMGLLEVAELRANWLGRNPEIEVWWQKELEEFRAQGYRREIVWGRRCDFLDGEDQNEIVNYDEQAGCAAILHDDTFQVLEQIPFEKWGPYSGLIHSEHDKIVIEHPESESKWVEGVVGEAMNRTVSQIPNVRFTAKPKTCDTFQG